MILTSAAQATPQATAAPAAQPAAAASPPLATRSDAAAAWSRDARGGLTLIEALASARRTAEEITALRFDSIAASGPAEGGGWRVVVDLVEAKARIGSNDLLSAFEVVLSDDGALTAFSRLRRYNREDDGA